MVQPFDSDKQRLMRRATYASVTVAVSIITIKFIAWLMTDSLSLMASLVDSVLDVASSVINLMAVRYALKPADEDHRFGHGKAEDIAAFAQSAFIAGSALFVGVEAIQRFISPTKLEHMDVGIAVMLVSIVLTAGLVWFQNYVIKRTGSSVVRADALHYQTDLLVNAMVIVSLLVSPYVPVFDPVCGLAIALYIMKGAWGVGRQAFDHLMDKEFDEAEREKIIDAALSCEKVKGVHDLRTRRSGMRTFIQMHIELKGDLKLKEAHDVADAVEQAVLKEFPGADVLVHLDPMTDNEIDLGKNHVVSVKG